MLVVAHKAYEAMLTAYREGQNAFEELNKFLGLSLPIGDYLYIYRNHKPKIVRGLLKEECSGILTEFFRELRKKRKEQRKLLRQRGFHEE